ncbi:MAG: 3'(2'),5'-bisphosphate nucleotidase CysQ [Proteobacteria bacterium]|nr:3'(2'),5'-bisphosphate nucleotidase CysQ [Pseudomonadota bacterium]
MLDLDALARAVLPIAADAGKAIMAVYESEFAVQRKRDDSPLTRADLDSQRTILRELRALTPDIPVLSEEGAQTPWSERRHWRELWIVDPLDGTREFVKRNGEFTVNIALVVDHEPVLGCIGVPARDQLFWGVNRGAGAGGEAWLQRAAEAPQPIRVSAPQRPPRVAGSRSHTSPQTAHYLARLGPHRLLAVGSAIKFCLIAQGEADLYPRFGPTSEWDTAAGQAVLEAAGGQVTRLDGHRLRYNCRESLINGDFVAYNDARVLPEPAL